MSAGYGAKGVCPMCTAQMCTDCVWRILWYGGILLWEQVAENLCNIFFWEDFLQIYMYLFIFVYNWKKMSRMLYVLSAKHIV